MKPDQNPKRPLARRWRLTANLLAVVSLAACSGEPSSDASQRQAKQVGYIVANTTNVPLSVSLSGRTVAFETSEVRPQVSGVIRKRYFTEGSYVRAGQPLFQIDPSLYQAAVNQAAANLASAKASADAAIAKADRFKPLADMEAVAKQDYTDALSSARVAKASVAQNAAALDTARINLRFTNVPAPISGRIGRSLATVGALASASQTDPLALIQRTDPIYVDMQQSAADLVALRRKLAAGGVKPGSTQVHLQLDDGSQYGFTGTVEFSEVTVSEDTGTVTLRARFPNPDGLLLPGLFVTAVFDQASHPSAFLVPQNAIQHDFDGTAYVMVVGDDGKAARRKVVTDRTYETSSVVTSGLNKGDKIIVQGLNGLKQGAAIRPVAASSPQPVGPPEQGSAAGAGKDG
ncbi:efflux RND transporter periplasmic adaptor subunit [Novosphingobium mangrovi (ex Huang et al. 2023)]|uniref:Efflux RND transporter periplasmic adaptor subunit n=1 Tax=Novosphingobium mangrovi (ex Huang et al. 2023) TaxID=2976432 RepID=A0ABT2I8E2_9SPHN|nr:efflux RND transporter periplasmic adaptor subunit [Novosphingobium mangrovi (ex Huang et al. 2023)]MCT2401084.1 efflux RND transporter periplasmic adaptor subunit [Novosphingobium mangrovi (ex Huang et al. 2023)]